MHVRIKICGITNPADAESVATLGVDMIGLNFISKSPRLIDEPTAKSIVGVLPASVQAVALFVGQLRAVMKPMAQRLGIRTVQYYGDAPDASPDLQWIPAFSIASADD